MRINDDNADPPLQDAAVPPNQNILQDYLRVSLEKQRQKRAKREEMRNQCDKDAIAAGTNAAPPLQETLQQQEQDENLFHVSVHDLDLKRKSIPTAKSVEPLHHQQQQQDYHQEPFHHQHQALSSNNQGTTPNSTGLDFLADAATGLSTTSMDRSSSRRVSDAHGQKNEPATHFFGSSKRTFLFGSTLNSNTTNGMHHIQDSIQESTENPQARRVSDMHGTGQAVNPFSFPGASRPFESQASSLKAPPLPQGGKDTPFSFSSQNTQTDPRSKQKRRRGTIFFANAQPTTKPRRVSNEYGRLNNDSSAKTTTVAGNSLNEQGYHQGGIVYHDDDDDVSSRPSNKPRRVSNEHASENSGPLVVQQPRGKVLNKNKDAFMVAKEQVQGNSDDSSTVEPHEPSTIDEHGLEDARGTPTATTKPATTGKETSPLDEHMFDTSDDSDSEQTVVQGKLDASSDKKSAGTEVGEVVDLLTPLATSTTDQQVESHGTQDSGRVPDTGKFDDTGSVASQDSLPLDSSSDDEDDSSDDGGVWETRKIRSKSVIEDDVLEGTPEKKASSQGDLGESPLAFTGTPRSISPFEDTEDEDWDSITPKRSNKKKTKRLKKSPSPTNKKRKKMDGKVQVAATTRSDQSGKNQTQRRKKLAASKSTGSDANATFKGAHSIGDRVYAKWEKNDWYWGKISDIKNVEDSRYYRYSVLFDDGDSLDGLTHYAILSVSKFRSIYGEEPPPLSAPLLDESDIEMHESSSKAEEAPSSKSSPLSLERLFQVRCGECVNCSKDDCGQCASCLSNGGSRRQKVCLQKICCQIETDQKAQPMPPEANFPEEGWRFVIDETRKHYKVNAALAPPWEGSFGLKVIAPRGTEYYSVERAKTSQSKALKRVDVDAFYAYIGAKKSSKSGASTGKVSAGGKGATSRTSRPSFSVSRSTSSRGEGIGIRPCGACENCRKDACGNCAMCRSGESRSCFQKMCFKVPVDVKAQTAVGFPNGWRFYFAVEKAGPQTDGRYVNKPIPGLYIISPSGKMQYRSVKAAGNKGRLPDLDSIARTFYAHVGVVDMSAKTDRPSNPAPLEPSLSEFCVVGSRVFCMEGKGGRWGTIVEKFEVADGDYVYSVRLEDDNSLLEDVGMGNVLSEVRYKSKTGMDPPPAPLSTDNVGELEYDSDASEERPHKKQKVGLSTAAMMVTSTDHFLIGKKLCFAWTDLKSQRKVVYGTVVECEKNTENGNVHRFKVLYNKRSRDTANSVSNGCSSAVPESQMLQPSMVVGGCKLYEQMVQTSSRSARLETSRMHSWNWITPDLRHEQLIENRNGTSLLPRLTLAVRGYKLVLNVKPSTIQNAGNGVFLSCMPLTKSDDDQDVSMQPFELQAGELVDLGAYGPFRIQDRKLEAVFFAKNFVHSHKCEEWAFDSGDSRFQLDVTDEISGNVHDAAMSHIPAFVNESPVQENVCVHAEHDPEGSVHYLLGHKDKSQGSLVLPPDGTEMEIFVNYGNGYELVRVRKGYSFLSDDDSDQKKHLLKVIAHEDIMDVKEMDQFGAAEVEATIDYFVNLYTKESEVRFSNSVLQRALVVAVVLQNRTRQLFMNEKAGDENMESSESTVNMRKVLKLSAVLVSLLLDMVRDDKHDRLKELQAAGDLDGLLGHVLEMHFSKKDLAKLRDLMK